MKILVLTFYFEPDLCAGSFRTTPFVNELQQISADRDTIDVLTTMPNRYGTFLANALVYEKNKNVTVHRIDLGTHKSGFIDQSLLFVKYALNVYKIIRKKEKYDIVYATSSRLMTAFLGALIANHQKSKLFLDIRDIFTDTLESIFAKKKLKYIIPLFRIIEKYTIKSANHINLVSKGFEYYFKNINDNIQYSFYLNGIDDIFLNYDFENEEENEKKIITYAGNIGEGQGLERIIPQMAEKLGDMYIINIVGDGGKKNILEDKVKNLKNVNLLSPVKRDELLLIYKKSDYLFLHLNDYSAFKKVLPSKLFEYGATNKKIIAGVGGYAAEFIKEHLPNAIVFEPCNCNDLMKKMKLLSKDSNMNRSKFIHEFSRSRIMKKLVKEVYTL